MCRIDEARAHQERSISKGEAAMTTWSETPLRAEHVGSLLRPDSLRRAHREHASGLINADALREVTDRAIVDTVRMQEEVELRVVTDGEFRRASWFVDFVEKVRGFALEKVTAFPFRREGSETASWRGPVVRGKVGRSGSIVVDDFVFLDATTDAVAKVTLPTPSAMHFFGGPKGVDRNIYPALEDFFADLAEIYRQELVALREAGCRYVQLDEVPLALLCDPAIRDILTARGDDPDHLTGLYIGAVNSVLRDRSADMFIAMHVCRGNYKGRWMGAGGYGPIAERLFNETAVDAFLLEFDTERAGTFEPLRYLPATKQAFLGLISTKTNTVETVDALRSRLDDAFRYADPSQLGICPQCGFASSVGGNPITPEAQRMKLRLAVEVARQTWGTA
jgi:5-methyltetrahydropteroyltriglutamate--homocysteine methyltransferase